MNGWMDRLLNENADGRAQRKGGSRSNSGQGRKINQMRETGVWNPGEKKGRCRPSSTGEGSSRNASGKHGFRWDIQG